jgi:hypothetical protein
LKRGIQLIDEEWKKIDQPTMRKLENPFHEFKSVVSTTVSNSISVDNVCNVSPTGSNSISVDNVCKPILCYITLTRSRVIWTMCPCLYIICHPFVGISTRRRYTLCNAMGSRITYQDSIQPDAAVSYGTNYGIFVAIVTIITRFRERSTCNKELRRRSDTAESGTSSADDIHIEISSTGGFRLQPQLEDTTSC